MVDVYPMISIITLHVRLKQIKRMTMSEWFKKKNTIISTKAHFKHTVKGNTWGR